MESRLFLLTSRDGSIINLIILHQFRCRVKVLFAYFLSGYQLKGVLLFPAYRCYCKDACGTAAISQKPARHPTAVLNTTSRQPGRVSANLLPDDGPNTAFQNPGRQTMPTDGAEPACMHDCHKLRRLIAQSVRTERSGKMGAAVLAQDIPAT